MQIVVLFVSVQANASRSSLLIVASRLQYRITVFNTVVYTFFFYFIFYRLIMAQQSCFTNVCSICLSEWETRSP